MSVTRHEVRQVRRAVATVIIWGLGQRDAIATEVTCGSGCAAGSPPGGSTRTAVLREGGEAPRAATLAGVSSGTATPTPSGERVFSEIPGGNKHEYRLNGDGSNYVAWAVVRYSR